MKLFGKALAVSLMLFCGSAMAEDYKWEFVKEKNGTKVWSADVKGQDLLLFKGSKTIDVPIEKAMGALFTRDVEKLSNIKDFLGSAKRIETKPNYVFQQELYDLPWPVSNREFLLKYNMNFDKANKSVRVDWTTVDEHPDFAVHDGDVRAATNGYWEFKRTKDNKTEAFVQVLVDLRGSLPKFLVNIINSDWAPNTVGGIEKEAPTAKPHQDTIRALGLKGARPTLSH